jgi:hypothetical protein
MERMKTCRRCSEPLPGDCHLWTAGLTFPVKGIGSMHMRCALAHCEHEGITLAEATPICKHWTKRGFCLYQASYRPFCGPECMLCLHAVQ